MQRFTACLIVVLGALLVAGPLPGQPVPLRNWKPAASADIGHTSPFQGITPCRVVDTRWANGPFGGPKFTARQTRTFTIPAGPCSGIPVAEAYSLNITIIGYEGDGYLSLWPAGGAQPVVSTLNFGAGTIIANAAVVPADASGAIAVYAWNPTHVIIDINGYYTNEGALKQYSVVANVVNDGAIRAENTNTTSGSAAIHAIAHGAAWGVRAESTSTNNSGFGVLATHSGLGAAVAGLAVAGVGVAGASDTNTGVQGTAPSGWGVVGEAHSGIGVFASAIDAGGLPFYAYQSASSPNVGDRAIRAVTYAQTTKRTHAIQAESGSSALNGSAILAIEASGVPAAWGNSLWFIPSAILGISKNELAIGGLSEYVGVTGTVLNPAGSLLAQGTLGSSTGPYGVFSYGNFGGTGGKYFVEPHPTDATQVIRYVALEGPESGTYFRGRARFVDHRATIPVPESFRIVTDADGLSANVTPIGDFANVTVKKLDLNAIEVASTNDVEFSYVVYGVRKALKDHVAIAEGREFVPQGPESKMPGYLTEEARQRLISNGTYNPDGSVNMSTAERLGWAKEWRDAAAAAEQRAADVNAQHAAEPKPPVRP